MDAAAVMAISELAKMGLVVYMNYMKQAGLTPEQIDIVFNDVKLKMLSKDPALIPDK